MQETDLQATIQLISAAIIPILFGIALHEVSHGWVARFFGDHTAERLGRLSLNPLRHIDPVGTVAVPLILALLNMPLFGWAKPVPVNAKALRNPKRDMMAVAIAGPLSNMVMALFWALILAITVKGVAPTVGARQFLLSMSQFGIQINVLLAVFNLLPIPPLDGGRVLRGVLPETLGRKLDVAEPYGLIIVMALLATGILGGVVAPFVVALAELFFSLAGMH